MSRGNSIFITPEPKGRFIEGYVNTGEAPKPGQIVQTDPTQSRIGGRFVLPLYNVAADGSRPSGPFIVLTEDALQGRLMTTAYAAGERCFGYVPAAGEELNLLWANVSGTATIAAGTVGIVQDGTGKIIATASTPETEVCLLLENIVDNTADQLAWCEWTGH